MLVKGGHYGSWLVDLKTSKTRMILVACNVTPFTNVD